MKITKVEIKKPKIDSWYLVKCPEYSESGWEIAKWTGTEWEHGHFSQSCHEYVIGYVDNPLV